jgi:hypothetical protein
MAIINGMGTKIDKQTRNRYCIVKYLIPLFNTQSYLTYFIFISLGIVASLYNSTSDRISTVHYLQLIMILFYHFCKLDI